MYGDFLPKLPYIHPYIPINVWFWPTLIKFLLSLCEPYICTEYDHMYGDFPAKSTVYTPVYTYKCGSDQP
jgi:hypothetical protein